MTIAFENIASAAQEDNPFFASWARPGNEISLVVDRILVNPEAIEGMIFQDVSVFLEDAIDRVKGWTKELQKISELNHRITPLQRLRSLLFGTSFLSEPLKVAAKRFAVIRESFDELMDKRVSSLVYSEAAVSWLRLVAEEMGSRRLNESGMEKYIILRQYEAALEDIAHMDRIILQRLQTSETVMENTAMALEAQIIAVNCLRAGAK